MGLSLLRVNDFAPVVINHYMNHGVELNHFHLLSCAGGEIVWDVKKDFFKK